MIGSANSRPVSQHLLVGGAAPPLPAPVGVAPALDPLPGGGPLVAGGGGDVLRAPGGTVIGAVDPAAATAAAAAAVIAITEVGCGGPDDGGDDGADVF